jgi:serine/threonine protein kinase
MAEFAAIPQPGDLFAGKYLIDRVIGGGDSSIVFGARHRVTRKPVAIRWYAPGADAEVLPDASDAAAEHEIVGHFRHPNTLEVFDTGEAAGSQYAVIEWLEGESLDERLRRTGPLPLKEACRLLVPCMRGLHEAHAAGIVHRELKPACIFICTATRSSPETVKVLDFELNKTSEVPRTGSAAVTWPTSSASDPTYRAPEQLRGRAPDLRADVYAFGAILFETLSGRVPDASSAPNSLRLAQTARSRSQPVRPLPPAAQWVVARAMSHDVSERFQTLREFADALEALAMPARSHTHFGPRTTLPFGALAPSSQLPPSLPSQPPPMPLPTMPQPIASGPWRRPKRRVGAGLYIALGMALLAGAALAMDQFAIAGDDDVIASFSAVGKYSATPENEPQNEAETVPAVSAPNAAGKPAANKPNAPNVTEERGASTPTEPVAPEIAPPEEAERAAAVDEPGPRRSSRSRPSLRSSNPAPAAPREGKRAPRAETRDDRPAAAFPRLDSAAKAGVAAPRAEPAQKPESLDGMGLM